MVHDVTISAGEVSVHITTKIGFAGNKSVVVHFNGEEEATVYKFEGLVSYTDSLIVYRKCKVSSVDVFSVMEKHRLQSPLQACRLKYGGHVVCTDRSLSVTRKDIYNEVLAKINPELGNKKHINSVLCGIMFDHNNLVSRAADAIVKEIVRTKYPIRTVLSEIAVESVDTSYIMFVALKEFQQVAEQVNSAPAGPIEVTIKGETYTVNNNWSGKLDQIDNATAAKIQTLLNHPDASSIKRHLPDFIKCMEISYSGDIICMCM